MKALIVDCIPKHGASEAGGPNGAMFPMWGPTKMRDRAREALVAAGLFRESARRRFEREQHNRLQAGGYE